MGQLLIKKLEEEKAKSKSSELIKKFQELKNTEIERAPQYKILNLRMIVGCGCGGNYTDIHVKVPADYNSPYDPGDHIDDDDVSRYFGNYEVYKGKYTGNVENHNPDRYERII